MILKVLVFYNQLIMRRMKLEYWSFHGTLSVNNEFKMDKELIDGLVSW